MTVGLAIACLVGFGSAALVLDRDRPFGAVTAGAWSAWPASGSPDADPYTKAMQARSGEVPLGAGEGLIFIAEADDAGTPLSGRCSYRIVGQTPAARLWTLTAYDAEGHLMDNAVRRTSFHSREILREADGRFVIAIGPEAEPGNWLPVATGGSFRLLLRLYDTPVGSGSDVRDLVMPRIERGECR
nr:DUF1214 domain-containing protein [Prosthecomicrobium pneumaticum]